MHRFVFSILLIASFYIASTSHARQQWQAWETHPKVPEISATAAKELVLAGENVIFIYTGYKVPEWLCGSLYIPYTLVPPSSDGSRVALTSIPKDWWVLCYCP